ncbi:hypothetical protein V7796_31730 [Rhizobium laguerreae]
MNYLWLFAVAGGAAAPAAPVRVSDREQSQQRLPAAATTEKDLPGN